MFIKLNSIQTLLKLDNLPMKSVFVLKKCLKILSYVQ